MARDSESARGSEAAAGACHAMTGEQVLDVLGVNEQGLSEAEAARRLKRYGQNRLPEMRRESAIRRLLRQFNNVLIYVLLIAAAITATMAIMGDGDEWIDTAVILGVVIINAIIGFLQEGKAERSLEAVRQMLSHKAMVLRDGRRVTIDAQHLVPGDIVFLQSGDRVPADLRLLQSRDLRIQEAALTGESLPTEKSIEPVDANAGVADRTNMAYSGTLVTYGQAMGVVTATGEQTELGRISVMLSDVEPLTTPLLVKIATFGRWLSTVILALAGFTFLVGFFMHRDVYEVDVLLMAVVALAVAAIPEGLPAIMTITLALGVQRMSRRNAIIRRLPAVDTLGSVTVICTDKTGTLTRNEMTVTAVVTPEGRYDVNGVGYAPNGDFMHNGEPIDPAKHPDLEEALRAVLLCNDAAVNESKDYHWQAHGDPTEAALITVAMKGRFDPQHERQNWRRIDAIPFESEHKYMASLNQRDGDTGPPRIFVKGAPEQILAMCSHQGVGETLKPLDTRYWERMSHELASQGRRVLAVAWKEAASHQQEIEHSDVARGLSLLGLFAMMDPPRPEAAAAVRACQEAGIRVKMITGDHALTACVIGRELNIGDGEHSVTGQQIETMSEEELRRVTREVDVFARVSPEHKLRLVAAMQAEGHVVAMTGDGVNDAPALKRADVGVAMGRKGTEVAREAAHMVLTDDNFASIAHAVEEGRTVYDNLRKAIIFILPTNGAETLTVVVAILLGLALPITAVQILWVNLATEITLSLALAFEPPEPGVMKRPPRRPDAPLLTPFFYWRIASVSLLAFAGTLGAFLWTLSPTGNPFFAPQFDAEHLALARTVAVNTLVMLELVYLFNTRFIVGSALSRAGLLGSPYVLGASAAVMGLQLLFTYLPVAQRLFDTRPMSATHWGLVLGVSLAVFFIVEVEKAIVRRLGVRL